MLPTFRRAQADILQDRLREPRRFLQVIAGPRQVGKTTLVRQVLEDFPGPSVYATADEPGLRGGPWLSQQWERARRMVPDSEAEEPRHTLLVLDEIQKLPDWSETVKRLWDEDTREGAPVKVVLLGSAPLLMRQGLTESLAGRFETIHLSHWSAREMAEAFGWSVEQWIVQGGYPGSAPLAGDFDRWSRYVRDALVETTISRDVLLMTRVDKPALLRQLFELGCLFSGQVLSYNKMLGQLQDAGNTTTLAGYLELLASAGMVMGLPKYSGREVRQRASSPKLQVLNTALMTAVSGRSPTEVEEDRDYRGRLVESAVGAHLAAAASAGRLELHYWRQGNHEVDFVVEAGPRLIALEVKSGRPRPGGHVGTQAFLSAYPDATPLLVGGDGIPLEDFLLADPLRWL